jgi:hypothetical protein
MTEVQHVETNEVVIVREALTGPSLTSQPVHAAQLLFIVVCDYLPPRLPKIQDEKSKSLC